MSNSNTIRFFFCALALLIFGRAVGQECGNCKVRPKVALYDLDVKVAQLSEEGDGLFQWKQLFWLGRYANDALFQNNRNCVTFTQPPSVDDGESQQLMIGETYTNLPKGGNLSAYGSYIITGSVTGSGESYTIRMELQTACGRKTVATSEESFVLSNDMNTEGIGHRVAAKLTPLIEKISTWEKEEKARQKSASLDQFSWVPIKVTPLKKAIKGGESTDVVIEVLDCDGRPMEGREVFFTKSKFEGFDLQGTQGGVVTPAKVTTDAQGKATVKFRLNPGAKNAVIHAHSFGKDVKGCADAFTGHGLVNILVTRSGYIKYSFEASDICKEEGTQNCAVHVAQWTIATSINYTAVFSYVSEYQSDIVFGFASGDDAGVSESVPSLMDGGGMKYFSQDNKKITITCGANSTTTQRSKIKFGGELRESSANLSFGESFKLFTADLDFDTKGESSFSQTGLGSSSAATNDPFTWVVMITSDDKNYVFNKSASGKTTIYTLSGTKALTFKCGGTTETIDVKVTEE